MAEDTADSFVLIVDEMPLKRALVTQFLSEWANGLGLSIVSSSLSDVVAAERPLGCRLVVLSIGASNASEPRVIEAYRAVAAIGSNPPVVAIGDRPTVANVEAALGAGMAGYIPTSLEAAVAVAALNFVLAGGSYVPPEVVLRHDDDPPRVPDSGSRTTQPLRAEGQVFREQNPPSGDGGGADGNRPVRGALEAPAEGEEAPGGDLTNRQQQVLGCLQRARSNKEIARELDMSEATVKVHVRQIMKKLGASNRTHAAVIAVAPGRTAIRLAPVQTCSIQFHKRPAAPAQQARPDPPRPASDDAAPRQISDVASMWSRGVP